MTVEPAQRWGSTLDSVVVYAQGAVCHRLARGVVPPDGRVRVTGLPRSMDPDSLRARVLGASGRRVTGARVEVEAGAEPSTIENGTGTGTGTPDELRREVDRLREAHAAAQGRRDRQIGLIKEIRELHPVPPARRRDDPHRRTPVDAWLELADFVDGRLAVLHSRLVELEAALRDVEHELAVAADRLSRASTDTPSAHVSTTVSVLLSLDAVDSLASLGSADSADGSGDALEEPELTLELEYGVPGAVWAPSYRLTHRQGDSDGRLMLRASVAQRTGEDWTGVRIALATADLQRRTDLPKLRSIRVGRRQAAPTVSGWREPPAGLGDLFAGYDAAGPAPAPAAVPAPAGAGSPSLPTTVGSAAPRPPAPAPLRAAAPAPAPAPAPQAYGGPPPPALAAPGGSYGAAARGSGEGTVAG
ncbi:DUF4139 domain-containing protein, partial [Streptomyces sp. NPDC002073]